MACRLRTISTGRHVAPAAPPILGRIEENAHAAGVGAAANPIQLPGDKRVRRRLNDGDHEAGECVAHRDERTTKCTVGLEVHAARAGTATEDTIYLGQRIHSDPVADDAAFSERAERGAHTAGVDQRGRSTSGLLHGAAADACAPLEIENAGGLEPLHEGFEIVQGVTIARGELAVDEIEPEALTDEGERRTSSCHRRRVLHLGIRCELEHCADKHTTRHNAQQAETRNAFAGWCLRERFFVCNGLGMDSIVLASDRLRLVAVGSKNPVKVAAVRSILARIAPRAVVDAVAVSSGVPDQPFGDDETIRGALARARAAREAVGAELGFGIEGGVVDMPDGSMRTCAWAAVVSADGRHGVGGSLAMPLPNSVARLIREQGMELGHAMDELTGQRETKHGAGAVGILTAGLVDRQHAYEVLIAYAMAPFLGVQY